MRYILCSLFLMIVLTFFVSMIVIWIIGLYLHADTYLTSAIVLTGVIETIMICASVIFVSIKNNKINFK